MGVRLSLPVLSISVKLIIMKEKIREIVQEFKKVQWPTWDNLQNDAIVVAVASIIIALIIYLMDQSFNNLLGWFYSIF